EGNGLVAVAVAPAVGAGEAGTCERDGNGFEKRGGFHGQFCCPGGVLLSSNGQTPFLNLSTSTPLSWQVVHSLPFLASRWTCAEHQSGPPARQLLPNGWLE